MLTHFLDRFEPSDQPLLDLIFEHVDDSMLFDMAKADYGDDIDLHLAALHQIKAKNIPVPLPWYPAEVLCLARWTELDNLITQDGVVLQAKPSTKRDHWIRLFACTVLIWASLEPENYEDDKGYWYYIEGESSTIVQLFESAINLGNEATIAALKFLSWRMKSQMQKAAIDEDFGECPCYAIAILLLYVSLFGGASPIGNQCDPEMISGLIAVAHCNNAYIPVHREISNCQRQQKWRDAIHQILLDSTASDYARSNQEIQTFAKKLLH
jgi:hypothetical protein